MSSLRRRLFPVTSTDSTTRWDGVCWAVTSRGTAKKVANPTTRLKNESRNTQYECIGTNSLSSSYRASETSGSLWVIKNSRDRNFKTKLLGSNRVEDRTMIQSSNGPLPTSTQQSGAL